MKRIRLLLVTLLVIVGATTGWAQTSYGIKIGGVEITSANYTSIKASNGFTGVTGGKVTYDPASNMLTLNNAGIQSIDDSDDYSAITVDNDGVTIFLIGENTVTAPGTSDQHHAGMIIRKDATIMGSGSLELTSGYDCGIFIKATSTSPATLTIKDCTVSAEGAWGISGNKAGCNLVVDGANVNAKGGEESIYGSICDLASLTLNNCSITAPSGAVWKRTASAA